MQFRDVAEIAAALRDLGQAGVILSPQDEAVKELFHMMGLSQPTSVPMEEDVMLDNRFRDLVQTQEDMAGGQPQPGGPPAPPPQGGQNDAGNR